MTRTDVLRLRFEVDGDGRVRASLLGTERQLETLDDRVNRAAGSWGRFRASIGGVGSAIAGLGLALVTREVIQMSDSMTLLNARIKLFSDNSAQAARTQDELYRIAQRSRTSLDAVARVFADLAQNRREIGITNDELLTFTETLSKLRTISGAGGEAGRNAIVQLTQGLSSGELRGEELRSVLEQLPALVDVVVKKMNEWSGSTQYTRASFRELAFQGKITADLITRAVIESAEETDRRFAEIPATIGQKFTTIKNTITRNIGELRGESDSVESLTDSLEDLNTALNDPEVVKGIQTIATSLITMVRWAAEATTVFTQLGRQIGIVFAELATGSPLGSEESIEQRLQFLRRERARGIVAQGSGMPFRIATGEAAMEGFGFAAALLSGDIASITDRIATSGTASTPEQIEAINQQISMLESLLSPQGESSATGSSASGGNGVSGGDKPDVPGLGGGLSVEQVDKALANVQERLLKIRGEDARASAQAIEREYGTLIDTLKKMGRSEDADLVQDLIDAEKAKARFAEIEDAYRATMDTLSQQTQGIRAQVEAGLLSEAEGARRIADLNREAASALQENLLPRMRELAQELGPEAKQALARITAELERLQTVSDRVTAQVRAGLESAFGAGLNQLFNDLRNGIHSLEGALKAFSDAVLDAFQRIIVDAATQQLVQLFMNWFSPSPGGEPTQLPDMTVTPSGASVGGQPVPQMSSALGKSGGGYASMKGDGGGGGGSVSVQVFNSTGEKSSVKQERASDGTRRIKVMIGDAVAEDIYENGRVAQAITATFGARRVGS